MTHPSTEAHRFTTVGKRVYVRGDCPRCRHATSDAGPPDWQPARVVEYTERDADGKTVACVNELQPCPWTLCPRRRAHDDRGS